MIESLCPMGAILICVSVCVSEYLCEGGELIDKVGQKLNIEQSGTVAALMSGLVAAKFSF